MTKKILLRMIPLILSTVLIFPGCKKFFDYFDHPNGKDPRSVKIEKIIWSPGDTLSFTYNSHGDPVRGLRTRLDDGQDNWHFTYDEFGRISTAFALFRDTVNSDGTVNGFGDFYHKFVYDGWNRIVIDTFFGGPVVDHNELKIFHAATTLSKVGYDDKGRVIADTVYSFNSDRTPGSFQQIINYTYDPNGNRVFDLNTAYDNKVNPNRTHPFWAFINRDYSLNNMQPAAAYNSYGLPTKSVQVWRFLHEGGTLGFVYDKN